MAGGEKARIFEFDSDGGSVNSTIRGPIFKADKVCADVMVDDQEKAQKFLQGLRNEVRQVLYAWNIRTYENVVEKATTIERNMVSQEELKLGGDAKVEDRNKDKLVNPSTVQFKRPNGAKFKKDRYCKKC